MRNLELKLPIKLIPFDIYQLNADLDYKHDDLVSFAGIMKIIKVSLGRI